MTDPLRALVGHETPFALNLRFVDVDVTVHCNDLALRDRLAAYYGASVVGVAPDGRTERVRLVQASVAPDGAFEDVRRLDGKKIKEAVRESPAGRLILKRQTRVLMGLTSGLAFAIGDLRTHLKQAINLVNACYAKAVLRRGHVLFHAAAVSAQGRTAVMAGPPGAGKSTAALHLVEEGCQLLSNDRVLARRMAEDVEALGYPKQPRVNPGTLLHHPRLVALLDADDRAALGTLTADELWRLERKCDVDVDAIYGKGTMELRGIMRALLLLKWRMGAEGFSVRRLTPVEALGDLALYRKDLGVFDPDNPVSDRSAADTARYAEILRAVEIVEITGGVVMPALVKVVRELLDR